MKKLAILILAAGMIMSLGGCDRKKHTFEELRAAVVKHLEDKYGEEFVEYSAAGGGFYDPVDRFYMYPKNGKEEERFLVTADRDADDMRIRDGYFALLIYEEYRRYMEDLFHEYFDEFILDFAKQNDEVFHDSYNRDTKLSDLYREGQPLRYQSSMWIYIKESALSGNNVAELLQEIAEVMLEQQLECYIGVRVIRNEKYNDFLSKTPDERSYATGRSLTGKESFVYSPEGISKYAVLVLEERDSGNLTIEYSESKY